MSPKPLALRRQLANALLPRETSLLECRRVRLPDGAHTTVHVASYERTAYTPRVAVLERPAPLVRWCREEGIRHAVVGGFFLRPDYAPLGELRIAGRAHAFVPFAAPWGDVRACVQIVDDEPRIASRVALGSEPAGDVLQAGPLLVQGGQPVLADGEDPEGFSVAAHQFDSDITVGRYPRAALALAGECMLAVTCDGRTRRDAGMTLAELAGALVDLGATDALNLDGGGSASLVHDGRLRNRPREEHGTDLLEGRSIVTAIVFDPV